MTLKKAIDVLLDYYQVEQDGTDIQIATVQIQPPPREVWAAWAVLLKRNKRDDRPS